MRIVIAEDEFIERKSMRKFIEHNFNNMEVVGEAVNGREAIEQAKKLLPDVMIMDVKMPGINGIEAIKQIYAFDDSIKFIMLSAYDSFDYAKEAMTYGIKDYILKPGKNEEIVRTLLRLKSEIAEDTQILVEKQQSEKWRQERLIKKIMQRPLPEDTEQDQKALYPYMKSGYFLVVMFEEDLSVANIHHHLESNMPHPFIVLENDHYFIVCVVADVSLQKEDVLPKAQQLHFALGDAVFIGVGLPYTRLDQLQRSYHEAYAACFQLKAQNKRKYGFLEKTEKSMDDIHQDICQLIEKGKDEEVVLLYKDNSHRYEEADREYLYIKVKELLYQHHIEYEDTAMSSLRMEADWAHFLKMCALHIASIHKSNQSMMQIKNYLLENYHQQISLEDAAAMIQLSTNYFSNIFKHTFGVTFTEYLTQLRLEKAKALMKENRHTLKEISYLIGYKDPNYFSRVFKKYYRQSPKQFQTDIFKK